MKARQISSKEPTTKYIVNENSYSALPIEIELPRKWVIDKAYNTNEVFKVAEETLPDIEQLAKAAFVFKSKPHWDELQRVLYIWNIDELYRRDITKNKFILQSLLRNKIVEIEQKNRSTYRFESKADFTPKKAIQELFDKAKSHRINRHPLLEELHKNGLSLEAIKIFLHNYYANNRVFHLFVATQSLITPMEMRTEIYKNLYDELGTGDSMMAHPILFLKNFITLGKPTAIKPLSETLYLFNCKFNTSFLCGQYHKGAGGLGFIEITMPDQMIKIVSGLKKSGMKERDLEFWKVHITIDLEHGKSWFEEMEKLIQSSEDAEQCLDGGLYLLDARATMYVGIWNDINRP